MNEFVRRPSRRRENKVYVPPADVVKRSLIKRSWTISRSDLREDGKSGEPDVQRPVSLERISPELRPPTAPHKPPRGHRPPADENEPPREALFCPASGAPPRGAPPRRYSMSSFDGVASCSSQLKSSALQDHDLHNHDLHNHDLYNHDLHNHDLYNHDLHNHDLYNHDLHNHDLNSHDLYNHDLNNYDLNNHDLQPSFDSSPVPQRRRLLPDLPQQQQQQQQHLSSHPAAECERRPSTLPRKHGQPHDPCHSLARPYHSPCLSHDPTRFHSMPHKGACSPTGQGRGHSEPPRRPHSPGAPTREHLTLGGYISSGPVTSTPIMHDPTLAHARHGISPPTPVPRDHSRLHASRPPDQGTATPQGRRPSQGVTRIIEIEVEREDGTFAPCRSQCRSPCRSPASRTPDNSDSCGKGSSSRPRPSTSSPELRPRQATSPSMPRPHRGTSPSKSQPWYTTSPPTQSPRLPSTTHASHPRLSSSHPRQSASPATIVPRQFSPTPTQPRVLAPTPTHPRSLAPTPTQPRILAPTPTQPRTLAPTPTQPRILAPTPTQPRILAPTPTQPRVPAITTTLMTSGFATTGRPRKSSHNPAGVRRSRSFQVGSPRMDDEYPASLSRESLSGQVARYVKELERGIQMTVENMMPKKHSLALGEHPRAPPSLSKDSNAARSLSLGRHHKEKSSTSSPSDTSDASAGKTELDDHSSCRHSNHSSHKHSDHSSHKHSDHSSLKHSDHSSHRHSDTASDIVLDAEKIIPESDDYKLVFISSDSSKDSELNSSIDSDNSGSPSRNVSSASAVNDSDNSGFIDESDWDYFESESQAGKHRKMAVAAPRTPAPARVDACVMTDGEYLSGGASEGEDSETELSLVHEPSLRVPLSATTPGHLRHKDTSKDTEKDVSVQDDLSSPPPPVSTQPLLTPLAAMDTKELHAMLRQTEVVQAEAQALQAALMGAFTPSESSLGGTSSGRWFKRSDSARSSAERSMGELSCHDQVRSAGSPHDSPALREYRKRVLTEIQNYYGVKQGPQAAGHSRHDTYRHLRQHRPRSATLEPLSSVSYQRRDKTSKQAVAGAPGSSVRQVPAAAASARKSSRDMCIQTEPGPGVCSSRCDEELTPEPQVCPPVPPRLTQSPQPQVCPPAPPRLTQGSVPPPPPRPVRCPEPLVCPTDPPRPMRGPEPQACPLAPPRPVRGPHHTLQAAAAASLSSLAQGRQSRTQGYPASCGSGGGDSGVGGGVGGGGRERAGGGNTSHLPLLPSFHLHLTLSRETSVALPSNSETEDSLGDYNSCVDSDLRGSSSSDFQYLGDRSERVKSVVSEGKSLKLSGVGSETQVGVEGSTEHGGCGGVVEGVSCSPSIAVSNTSHTPASCTARPPPPPPPPPPPITTTTMSVARPRRSAGRWAQHHQDSEGDLDALERVIQVEELSQDSSTPTPQPLLHQPGEDLHPHSSTTSEAEDTDEDVHVSRTYTIAVDGVDSETENDAVCNVLDTEDQDDDHTSSSSSNDSDTDEDKHVSKTYSLARSSSTDSDFEEKSDADVPENTAVLSAAVCLGEVEGEEWVVEAVNAALTLGAVQEETVETVNKELCRLLLDDVATQHNDNQSPFCRDNQQLDSRSGQLVDQVDSASGQETREEDSVTNVRYVNEELVGDVGVSAELTTVYEDGSSEALDKPPLCEDGETLTLSPCEGGEALTLSPCEGGGNETLDKPPCEGDESATLTLPQCKESETLTLPQCEESEALTLPQCEENEAITLPQCEESETLTLPWCKESETLTLPQCKESESLTLPQYEDGASAFTVKESVVVCARENEEKVSEESTSEKDNVIQVSHTEKTNEISSVVREESDASDECVSESGQCESDTEGVCGVGRLLPTHAPVDSEIILASEATAEVTATSEMAEEVTASSEVTEEVTASSEVTEEVTASSEVAEEVTATSEVAEEVTASSEVPEEVTATSEVPEEVTATSEMTEEVTAISEVAEEVTVVSEVAEVTTTSEVVEEVTTTQVEEVTATSEVAEEVTTTSEVADEVTTTSEVTDAGAVTSESTEEAEITSLSQVTSALGEATAAQDTSASPEADITEELSKVAATVHFEEEKPTCPTEDLVAPQDDVALETSLDDVEATSGKAIQPQESASDDEVNITCIPDEDTVVQVGEGAPLPAQASLPGHAVKSEEPLSEESEGADHGAESKAVAAGESDAHADTCVDAGSEQVEHSTAVTPSGGLTSVIHDAPAGHHVSALAPHTGTEVSSAPADTVLSGENHLSPNLDILQCDTTKVKDVSESSESGHSSAGESEVEGDDPSNIVKINVREEDNSRLEDDGVSIPVSSENLPQQVRRFAVRRVRSPEVVARHTPPVPSRHTKRSSSSDGVSSSSDIERSDADASDSADTVIEGGKLHAELRWFALQQRRHDHDDKSRDSDGPSSADSVLHGADSESQCSDNSEEGNLVSIVSVGDDDDHSTRLSSQGRIYIRSDSTDSDVQIKPTCIVVTGSSGAESGEDADGDTDGINVERNIRNEGNDVTILEVTSDGRRGHVMSVHVTSPDSSRSASPARRSQVSELQSMILTTRERQQQFRRSPTEMKESTSSLANYFTLTLGTDSPHAPRRLNKTPEIRRRKIDRPESVESPVPTGVASPSQTPDHSEGDLLAYEEHRGIDIEDGYNNSQEFDSWGDGERTVIFPDEFEEDVSFDEVNQEFTEGDEFDGDDMFVQQEVEERFDSIEDGESINSESNYSESSGDENCDREVELRGYCNRAIDFTLHTIIEESCEESDYERKSKEEEEAKADPSELEKYFYFGLGNGPADPKRYANEESEYSDTFSETSSSIFSEGLDIDSKYEEDIDPAELASSRLEKYFLTGFLGFERQPSIRSVGEDSELHTDESGSVGSDSEGSPSPEQPRKKLVRRPRGFRPGVVNRSLVTGDRWDGTPSDGSHHSEGDEVDRTLVSGEDEGSTESEETAFDKGDGQFDTIKRRKKKKGSGDYSDKKSDSDKSELRALEQHEIEHREEIFELKNSEALKSLVHEGEKVTKRVTIDCDKEIREKSDDKMEKEGDLSDRKYQSRDSGFIGSSDDLLKDKPEDTSKEHKNRLSSESSVEDGESSCKRNDPSQEVSHKSKESKSDSFDNDSNNNKSETEERSSGDGKVSRSSTGSSVDLPPFSPDKARNKICRKDSFNNWSSDEETNMMMNKMRAFFKTMISNSREAPKGQRVKPPQLLAFEAKLTNLMKTVPGINDEQVKEIVEYLSSEDTWSDSYDSSDYTSSDLEGAYALLDQADPEMRSDLQEQISASCQQIIQKFDQSREPSDTDSAHSLFGGRACSESSEDASPSSKDTVFVYQRLMSSISRLKPDSDRGSIGSGSQGASPPLLAKVMHHIGNRLVALMHEVSGGSENGDDDSLSGGHPVTSSPKVPLFIHRKHKSADSISIDSSVDKSSLTSTSFESEDSPTDTEQSPESDPGTPKAKKRHGPLSIISERSSAEDFTSLESQRTVFASHDSPRHQIRLDAARPHQNTVCERSLEERGVTNIQYFVTEGTNNEVEVWQSVTIDEDKFDARELHGVPRARRSARRQEARKAKSHMSLEKIHQEEVKTTTGERSESLGDLLDRVRSSEFSSSYEQLDSDSTLKASDSLDRHIGSSSSNIRLNASSRGSLTTSSRGSLAASSRGSLNAGSRGSLQGSSGPEEEEEKKPKKLNFFRYARRSSMPDTSKDRMSPEVRSTTLPRSNPTQVASTASLPRSQFALLNKTTPSVTSSTHVPFSPGSTLDRVAGSSVTGPRSARYHAPGYRPPPITTPKRTVSIPGLASLRKEAASTWSPQGKTPSYSLFSSISPRRS
ncbi:serine-rich adhesin for platelets-like isoform X3 [Cherax quadricarinatus]